jgi:phosphoribosylformimino-5-aminoimidazole carboxamide ribotide isomerase
MLMLMYSGVIAIRSRMEIIPVLDLKGGSVVHAKQGRRDTYQPIVSQLCTTSAPPDVLAALLRLHSFATIYVADLDAIEQHGAHSSLITELARAHPRLEFWLDSGKATMIDPKNVRHVVGSESMGASEKLRAIEPSAILSLDFRGDTFVGPLALLQRPSLWPQRVIVMTLARVGSGAGPDVERLATIKRRAGACRVYAAGGVRDRDDLDALRDTGMAGVLVASALHDGRLTPADLAYFG